MIQDVIDQLKIEAKRLRESATWTRPAWTSQQMIGRAQGFELAATMIEDDLEETRISRLEEKWGEEFENESENC